MIDGYDSLGMSHPARKAASLLRKVSAALTQTAQPEGGEAWTDAAYAAAKAYVNKGDAETKTACFIAGAMWATSAPPASQEQADDKHEQELIEALKDRDTYHEWADELANAIARHTGYEIGEHSSDNNPWRMALNALECHERTRQVPENDIGNTASHSQEQQPSQAEIDRLRQQVWEFTEAAGIQLAEILSLKDALAAIKQQPSGGDVVATVVERYYEDGTRAGNTLDWSGRNCENDLPVGTKLTIATPKPQPMTDERVTGDASDGCGEGPAGETGEDQ